MSDQKTQISQTHQKETCDKKSRKCKEEVYANKTTRKLILKEMVIEDKKRPIIRTILNYLILIFQILRLQSDLKKLYLIR